MAALEALGAPYLVGGRDMEALRSVAGPGCAGIRVAHAHDIGDAFEGVGCVLSTVGPFARLGLAPLDAAIAAGADTVYVADDDGLATYQIETYLPVLHGIVEQDGPKAVLLCRAVPVPGLTRPGKPVMAMLRSTLAREFRRQSRT